MPYLPCQTHPPFNLEAGHETKGTQMNSRKLAVAVAVLFAALSAHAQTMVGGAEMFASKDIIDNAVNSKDHTTLVAAVKAADLVTTLKGKGPFTVFAPTNDAFAKLPAGTIDTLLRPENKMMLTQILTYHVVPGRLDSGALRQRITEGNGKAWLTTVEGEKIIVTSSGGTIMLTDAKGGMSRVTTADVTQSNGVIHVVDSVAMPVGKGRSMGAGKRSTSPDAAQALAMEMNGG